MRNGQNKRMRGRNNHRKSHNPMVRVFESNGPDVKIRGNPSHIAEKYMQLARDAQTSGDPIAAENYYQHAEHYYRVIAAAQEQFRQNNPHFSRPENESPAGARDDGFDDGDDEGQPSVGAAGDSTYGTREPQPYIPRDAQPFPQHQPQPAPRRSRATHRPKATSTGCRPSSPAGSSRSINRTRPRPAAGPERPRQPARPLPAAPPAAPPSRPAPGHAGRR